MSCTWSFGKFFVLGYLCICSSCVEVTFLYLQVNLGIQNVQVMTFGQPRIGNAAFASYYTQLVPNTFRVTNDHDIVPHLPPYYSYFPQKTYHHFPREVMVCWVYYLWIKIKLVVNFSCSFRDWLLHLAFPLSLWME